MPSSLALQARCREFDSPRLHKTVIPNLPTVPEKRLAIRISPDALRQVRGGHPWVYDKAIVSNSNDQAPAGSLAVIFDADRKFAAIGLWDPASPIRLRILHVGKPAQIDRDFWTSRVERAAEQRASLDASGTTGWRLINGENDGLSGIIVDRYCLLYTSPSPRDRTRSRMPSSA